MTMKLLLVSTLLGLMAVEAVDGKVHAGLHKRSDDPMPLETIVMQQSTQLQELQAQLTAKTQALEAKIDSLSHRVSFLAQFAAGHVASLPNNSPYRFDKVIFNEGQGYDAMSGMFTAPVSGVYLFSLQIYLDGPQRSVVDIRLNGNIVSRMSLDTENLASIHGEDSNLSSVILQLNTGDRVWVTGLYPTSRYYGVFHTFFMGSLLHTN